MRYGHCTLRMPGDGTAWWRWPIVFGCETSVLRDRRLQSSTFREKNRSAFGTALRWRLQRSHQGIFSIFVRCLAYREIGAFSVRSDSCRPASSLRCRQRRVVFRACRLRFYQPLHDGVPQLLGHLAGSAVSDRRSDFTGQSSPCQRV